MHGDYDFLRLEDGAFVVCGTQTFNFIYLNLLSVEKLKLIGGAFSN